MVAELKSFFMTQGYREMGTNNSQLAVLYTEKDFHTDVMVLSDIISGIELTKEQYLNILRQVEQAFYQRGCNNITIVSLICTKNVDRVREFCAGSSYNSWIVDLQNNRLMIYENQQDHFKDVQRNVEQLLARREQSVYQGTMERQTRRSIKDRIQAYPVVTIAIIAINVLIYILVELTGSSESGYHLYQWGASEYDAIFNGHEYYRLFTSTFLHAGAEHLLNNMFVLAIIGERLERIIGKSRYIILYIATGLIASLGSVLYNHWIGEYAVGVGASGAIFGVIGGIFYIILRYHGKKTGITMNRMLIFIALSLYSGIANSSKVDNTAHIVGFISGIVVACIACLVGSKKGLGETNEN